MTKKLRFLSLTAGIALLSALFIVTGCSNQSPLEPNVPNAPELNKGMLFGQSSSELVVTSAELITVEDGGTISISRDEYEHLFKVDPGAVDSDVIISVTSSEEKIGRSTFAVFEFGPDGLVFDKPAQLLFQMAELNPSATYGNLYYFDPKINQWVYQGSAAVRDGVATFNISHFSKYAISD